MPYGISDLCGGLAVAEWGEGLICTVMERSTYSIPVVLVGLLSCDFLAIPAAGTVNCKFTHNITTQTPPRGIILVHSCYLSVSFIAS
jgi:hypothetical protein